MLLFHAKSTNNGLHFKNFFDMLVQLNPISSIQDNTGRKTCFKIGKNGIIVYVQNTSNSNFWIEASFDAANFAEYQLNTDIINIACDLAHMKTCLKNAKSKDDIVIEVTSDDDEYKIPSHIQVKVLKTNHQDMSINNRVMVENIQNEILQDDGQRMNQFHFDIINKAFSSIVRTVESNISQVKICIGGDGVNFTLFGDGMVFQTISLGDQSNCKYDYANTFDAKYLRNIGKMSTFSDIIKVYPDTTNGYIESENAVRTPIVFETKIRSENRVKYIGVVKVWIRPL